MLIKTGDNKIFMPDDYSINYKQKFNVEIIDTIQDGDFVEKSKNRNRSLTFTARFDPFNAQKFGASLQDKGKLKLFDLLEFSGFLEIQIQEVEYKHNYVVNYNYVQFDIQAVEIKQPKITVSAVLGVLSAVSTAVNIAQKASQMNLTAKLISLIADLALAPLFTIMNMATLTKNKFLAIKQQLRLIGVNLQKSFAKDVKPVFTTLKSVTSEISRQMNTLTENEKEDLITAFDIPLNSTKAAELKTPQEKEAAVLAGIFPIYNLCNLIFNIDFKKRTTAELVELQENLYKKLEFFTICETEITFDDNIKADLPSVFLLKTLAKIEDNLLIARQKHTVILDKFSDIIPLIYKFYKPKTPADFELYLLEFLETNNLKGDYLFGLEAGRKVEYYV